MLKRSTRIYFSFRFLICVLINFSYISKFLSLFFLLYTTFSIHASYTFDSCTVKSNFSVKSVFNVCYFVHVQ